MKVNKPGWKFMIIVGMLASAIMNVVIILPYLFLINSGFSYSSVKEAVKYADILSLFSPLLTAAISGIIVYHSNNRHKFRRSIVTAVLTVFISIILLFNVAGPTAGKLYDNYEEKENPPYCPI